MELFKLLSSEKGVYPVDESGIWCCVGSLLQCFRMMANCQVQVDLLLLPRQERCSPSFFLFLLSLHKTDSLFLLNLIQVSANSRLIPAASRISNQLPYRDTTPIPTLS